MTPIPYMTRLCCVLQQMDEGNEVLHCQAARCGSASPLLIEGEPADRGVTRSDL